MSSLPRRGPTRRAIPPGVALAFFVAPFVMLVTLLVHNGGIQHIHTEQFGSQIRAAWAHHTRYYVGHVGFVAGFVLLVPGLLALARELAAAGREGRARLGLGLVIVGLIGGSLSLGIDLANYQLTTPSRGGAAAVQALGHTNFAPEVLGPIAVLGLGVGIGLTLLVIEAVRIGLTPRWSAAAIAVGGFGAGLLFNTDLAVPNAAIFALGLGRLALGWPAAHDRRRVPARALGAAVLLTLVALLAPAGAMAHEDHPGAVAEAAANGEISLNVSGKPFRGATSYGEVRGLLDGHSHMMIDQGFGLNGACGQAWSPQGPAVALQDCPQHKTGGGAGAYLYNILESGVSGNPTVTHDSAGWPTFSGWPAWNVVMHQQVYYRWLERAWRAGLRTYTMLATDLGSACELNSYRTASCDETESAVRQIQATYALQRYIDQQSGGPGKGFFRIVKDPFEARRVINEGKLAVVMGVEVSELFGCGQRRGVPQCDRARIDRGLDEMQRLGVSRLFVSHKFDNALAGVAMDKEAAGALINSLQYQHTGRFWDIETCTGPAQDEYQVSLATNPFGDLVAGGAAPGALPAYPRRPHCNKLGLTPLGDYYVRGMIKRRMIVEVDHMSVHAREQTLNLLKAQHYSGVISSHSWSDEQSLPRILDLGGIITPMAGIASLPLACCYLDVWKRLRATRKAGPGQTLPIGFGDDMSSPAPQVPPRQAGEPLVRYPFRSFDGGTLVERQQSGTRTFDINTDGVAHFGLFPDWWEKLRLTAGSGITRDLAAGSEAYLEMWERAEGVPGPRCRFVRGHFKRRGLAWMRLGFTPRQLLFRAGQPATRHRAWSYCARAHRSPKGSVVAVFTRRARVGLVVSSARGHEASGIAPGTAQRRLRGRARRIGRGLWLHRAGRGVRFVYVVRRGRVRYVGAASRSVAKSAHRLRGYLRLAGARGF
jgi:hypothetical protein